MLKQIKKYPKTTLFCFGCLSALAMAPIYAWFLMALGYATLIYFLDKTTNVKQSALYSFLFFFGYFLTSLYWVSSSIFVEFERWWWALPFSFVGLPFLLSLFPTILTAIASLVPRFKSLAFIIALVLADFARSYLLTGFPWNLPAHTWVNNDLLMYSLPFTGFFGLNSLTIIIFGCLFLIPRHSAGIIIILLMASSFLPHGSEAPLQQKNITLIQANIPQNEKWDRNFVERNLNRYIDLSLKNSHKTTAPQIVIWPETAISRNILSHPPFQKKFENFLSRLPDGSILITGYLDYKGDDFFNSVIAMNKQGEIIASYDKHHLVPFGEYMPFGLDTLTGFNGFQPGSSPRPMHIRDDLSILPLICYEIIFPSYATAGKKSDFILNLTNDAWFGKTAGPYQHFDHARLRAAETQTTVIRLSGNGISGIIGKNGTVVKHTMLNQQAVISLP